jgi:hypothetical protein
MTAMKKEITPADILPYETYAKERKARRAAITAMKKNRRVEVGPYATFYFENYDTMFQQIQEMLHIEKGGAEQLEDELRAYNPLIPQGNELVATIMFEINDPGSKSISTSMSAARRWRAKPKRMSSAPRRTARPPPSTSSISASRPNRSRSSACPKRRSWSSSRTKIITTWRCCRRR